MIEDNQNHIFSFQDATSRTSSCALRSSSINNKENLGQDERKIKTKQREEVEENEPK
ncbi:MAG TPA: hypothetical protein VI278_09520 [Nitrososphaeraceae archaeon]